MQRYERGSTLITSNLPFDEWTETFGSERFTGALLGRLTRHVSIIGMNGDSYRLAQSGARKAASAHPQDRRRRMRETLVGLRPSDVPRMRRPMADFYFAVDKQPGHCRTLSSSRRNPTVPWCRNASRALANDPRIVLVTAADVMAAASRRREEETVWAWEI